jgi:hypothetical protein
MNEIYNDKYLIVRPKYGLCNQLYSISKGIIFGIISNRNVIFSNFQMDYRDENKMCNFEDIIDIVHIQEVINNKNLKIKIFSNNNITNSIKIKTGSDINISKIENFVDLLFYKENIDEQFLDIDNPISANIPKEYRNIEIYLNINIKFTEHYIKLSNNIKNLLKLENYTCVHLRLEDDSIHFMNDFNKNINFDKINNIYKQKYIDELDKLDYTNKTIYVCTSLGIDDNINNTFYEDLKIKYNLIDKNQFINIKNNEYREIYAIIDYIIAKDSSIFIGSDWSSFSIYIKNNHLYNNKCCKLINIWSDISKIKKIDI